MKKIKNFFLTIGYMSMLIFYPIISFGWYRFCRKKSDINGMKKFALYGIFGVAGLAGFAGMWFMPFPSWQHGCIAIFAGVSYGIGSYKQMKLIIERKEKK